MNSEFTYALFIAKPAAEVWRALTEKEIVDRYYLAPLFTLDLKKGGRISYGQDSEMIVGEIVKIEEGKNLTHTFAFVGAEDPLTTVSYELEAVGDSMCALTIRHTGYEAGSQGYANISGGWPVIASSLKTLLETGEGMPRPKS